MNTRAAHCRSLVGVAEIVTCKDPICREGRNADDIQIKIWLGEKPISITVSFQDVWPNVPEREEKKEALIADILKTLIPTLGNIVKMDA